MKAKLTLLIGLAFVLASTAGIAVALSDGASSPPGQELQNGTGPNKDACFEEPNVGDVKPYAPDSPVVSNNPNIAGEVPIGRFKDDGQTGYEPGQIGPIIEPYETPTIFEPGIDDDTILPTTPTKGPNLADATVPVPAPVEDVEILAMESYPVQYALVVYSGLPNSCVSFGWYDIKRDGDMIYVEVMNLVPADPETVSAQVYGTVVTRIALGTDFESGKTYTVTVNELTKTFIAQ